MFSQPAMLWALPAAALPLIIHLINRHRARRQPFPAIDFLLRVQRRSARRILLRQVLLLLVRTLLIAALVLAAAGPTLQPRGVAAGSGPTASCLVLDASLSMRTRHGDRSLFSLALDRARARVRALGPQDTACLLRAGGRLEPLVAPCSGSADALLDALDDQRPGWSTSDLSAAMGRAAELLAETPAGSRRQVVLLTDSARHAFSGPPRWPAGAAPAVVLEDVAADSERSNRAVLDVEQTRSGELLELSGRVVRHGAAGEQELAVEVVWSDRVVARGFAVLEADRPTRKLFSLHPPESGPLLGRIRLPADRLPVDDERQFLLSGHQRLNALLVNGDMRPVIHHDEVFYLEHALAPAGPAAVGVRFVTVTPDRLQPAQLAAADVVFLANVRDLAPAGREALREFVAGGGGLFIAVGDRVEIDHTNRMLGPLLPWQLRDVVTLGPVAPDGRIRAGLAFGDSAGDHPVLRLFNGPGARALSAVRTRRAVVLAPDRQQERSRVLIRYANGAPALVEGRYRAGRVLLFTSSLDRDWTNWPARASFLPFLQHAVAYLAGSLDVQPPPDIAVGAAVEVPALAEADRILIRTPRGEARELPVPGGDDAVVRFTETTRPGWYAVEQHAGGRALAGVTMPGFFVRPPAAESDPRPLAPASLRNWLGSGGRLTVAGRDGHGPRSLAGVLLLLALGLVLCEGLLIRR